MEVDVSEMISKECEWLIEQFQFPEEEIEQLSRPSGANPYERKLQELTQLLRDLVKERTRTAVKSRAFWDELEKEFRCVTADIARELQTILQQRDRKTEDRTRSNECLQFLRENHASLRSAGLADQFSTDAEVVRRELYKASVRWHAKRKKSGREELKRKLFAAYAEETCHHTSEVHNILLKIIDEMLNKEGGVTDALLKYDSAKGRDLVNYLGQGIEWKLNTQLKKRGWRSTEVREIIVSVQNARTEESGGATELASIEKDLTKAQHKHYMLLKLQTTFLELSESDKAKLAPYCKGGYIFRMEKVWTELSEALVPLWGAFRNTEKDVNNNLRELRVFENRLRDVEGSHYDLRRIEIELRASSINLDEDNGLARVQGQLEKIRNEAVGLQGSIEKTKEVLEGKQEALRNHGKEIWNKSQLSEDQMAYIVGSNGRNIAKNKSRLANEIRMNRRCKDAGQE